MFTEFRIRAGFRRESHALSHVGSYEVFHSLTLGILFNKFDIGIQHGANAGNRHTDGGVRNDLAYYRPVRGPDDIAKRCPPFVARARGLRVAGGRMKGDLWGLYQKFTVSIPETTKRKGQSAKSKGQGKR